MHDNAHLNLTQVSHFIFIIIAAPATLKYFAIQKNIEDCVLYSMLNMFCSIETLVKAKCSLQMTWVLISVTKI